MDDLVNSLPFTVAAVLVVSVVYGYWLWSRLRIGRYDGLATSAVIICMQFMYAFRTDNLALALVAMMYHIALVVAVFSASKGMSKAKLATVKARSTAATTANSP